MGVYDNEDYRRMKNEVKDAYPTFSWAWKVDHMKPSQVIAIWNNLCNKKAAKPKRDRSNKQMSLFDLYPEVMGGKVQ